MNLSLSLNKQVHARDKCNIYSTNCTKIISNASSLAVRSVVGWSVISWAVCAYFEAREIEKKQSLVLNLRVTIPIPSCSACFVPFLASLCIDPSSPQEKSEGRRVCTHVSENVISAIKCRMIIKDRMIFRHHPAGMNVHVDFNFF